MRNNQISKIFINLNGHSIRVAVFYSNIMKKGDLYFDGILGCWWICDTKKPKGRKLFIYPLNDFGKDPNRKGCTAYHDPETWNIQESDIHGNIYENPTLLKMYKGRISHFQQAFLDFAKSKSS